jgi:glycosyltransferase involved in cell wall biosynthesis
MSERALLVVSASVDEARAPVAEGRWPRKDFLELQRLLAADVIDHDTVRRRRSTRLMQRVVGMPATQAWLAFSLRSRSTAIYTDGEHNGIPQGVLLGLARHRPRHVTIGHLLTTGTKRAMLRWARPLRGIDTVMLHSTTQVAEARGPLGVDPARLALVPYQIDPSFWSPGAAPAEPLICSAGLEYRDYPTLIDAVRGLTVHAVIAAGSRWSVHRNTAAEAAPPPNVEVTSLDYAGLRDLYARSRIVVVPLRETRNQAGITTILEGMAMAKPVIVSATAGQRDVVRGRL